ncbi:hypothetical protein DPMN_182861 [Dreissena polymorpha]|uniref:Uncharacterized protein n=1 Tax=Dreissena polymorpha TaxID=45954 RepID=A0A9D4DG64_DREPO|nr:hypothetical protein DPMN_182861 [Dreissena polymorpha]
MPSRYSGRFVWVQRVRKDELVASVRLKKSQTSVFGLSMPNLPTVPDKFCYASGLMSAFQSPWTMRMSFFGTLAMMRSTSL